MGQSAVVVFSSHVVRGTVGLRAAALALEALGHSVWSIPTTVLSHHPGHGAPKKVVQGDDSFQQMVNHLQESRWTGEIDAVLCGYFASVSQVRTAIEFFETIGRKSPNKKPKLIVDPVIGDNGRLYVDEAIANCIRDELLPLADLITPNRFELAWLSAAKEFEDNNEILSAAKNLAGDADDNEQSILVTSAFPLMSGGTGSLYYSAGRALLAEHINIDNAPNGLGDLTSALITHHLLAGHKPAAALEKTTASTVEVLRKTVAAGSDELAIEQNISSLHRPFTPVQMRQLMVPTKT